MQAKVDLTRSKNNLLVCWWQDSVSAVTLRLLEMRTREAAPRLLPVLAAAAEALQKSSQQLAAWLRVHKAASAATKQAQAANAEAARLQVAALWADPRPYRNDACLLWRLLTTLFICYLMYKDFQERTQVYT